MSSALSGPAPWTLPVRFRGSSWFPRGRFAGPIRARAPRGAAYGRFTFLVDEGGFKLG